MGKQSRCASHTSVRFNGAAGVGPRMAIFFELTGLTPSASMGPRGLARGWAAYWRSQPERGQLQWGRGGWPADGEIERRKKRFA